MVAELNLDRFTPEMSNYDLTEISNQIIVDLRNHFIQQIIFEKRKQYPDLKLLEKFSAEADFYVGLHRSDLFFSKEEMVNTIKKYLPILQKLKK